MTPIISKPVQAMGTPSSNGGAVGVEQTDHSSLSHNENSYENETDLFLDPNLANIISSAVSNIKSNMYVNSKKKSRSRRVKDPCSVCSKNVAENQKAIQCTKCQLWLHASCNGIGKSEYAKLIVESDESKQQVNKNFLTNVNLHEYQLHSQPTKSACGGVAMYVKKSLDCKVLNHLNVLEDEFETLWIEINTGPKCKNIIVCCAYRDILTQMLINLLNTLNQLFLNLTKTKLFVLWVILTLIFSTMSPIVTPMNLLSPWYLIVFFHIFFSRLELLIIQQQL